MVDQVETAAETPEAEAEAEVKFRLIREQELADLRTVLDVPGGRRAVMRMVAKAGLFQSACLGEADPIKVGYRDGWRGFGLWLLQEVNDADPVAAGQITVNVIPKTE